MEAPTSWRVETCDRTLAARRRIARTSHTTGGRSRRETTPFAVGRCGGGSGPAGGGRRSGRRWRQPQRPRAPDRLRGGRRPADLSTISTSGTGDFRARCAATGSSTSSPTADSRATSCRPTSTWRTGDRGRDQRLPVPARPRRPRRQGTPACPARRDGTVTRHPRAGRRDRPGRPGHRARRVRRAAAGDPRRRDVRQRAHVEVPRGRDPRPAERRRRPTTTATSGPRGSGSYGIWTPEIAREMTSRWISEVPSKIV